VAQVTAIQEQSPSATAAREEGRLLARYLLGREDVPAEAVERYEAACAALFGAPDAAGEATSRFVARCPWSLPFVDAAAGLLDPHSLLRKKLFLMLAILETIPELAPCFTPRSSSRFLVLLKLGSWALLGGFKALLGIPLYLIARRPS